MANGLCGDIHIYSIYTGKYKYITYSKYILYIISKKTKQNKKHSLTHARYPQSHKQTKKKKKKKNGVWEKKRKRKRNETKPDTGSLSLSPP